MKKKYISEIAWCKIYSFLSSLKGVYVRCEEKTRRFIESVYWISRTGAQWREMHEYYGNWNSIYTRFNTWSKKNIWEKLLHFCIEDPDLEYIMIDSTIVRAHACAAGYGNQDTEGLGRSRGGFTSKIHTTADALGNPLKFIITPGQRNDCTQAKELIKGIYGAHIMGDAAYDSNDNRQQIFEQNCNAVIPSRKNRIEPYSYDEHLYKERHQIECFFGKIKHFRRLFSRFDKSARNYTAFLSFVGAIIWLR